MHRRTDAELLGLARGDGAACGELYDRYERPILVFMLRRTGDPELAADLTAEVFAAVLAGTERYDGPPDEPVIAWLLGIARDVHATSRHLGAAQDAARRAVALPRVALDDPAIRRLERLLAEQPAHDVGDLLEGLPDDQADAIRRHVLDGGEPERVAHDTNSSVAAVRQRVSRGLSALRNRLEHP